MTDERFDGLAQRLGGWILAALLLALAVAALLGISVREAPAQDRPWYAWERVGVAVGGDLVTYDNGLADELRGRVQAAANLTPHNSVASSVTYGLENRLTEWQATWRGRLYRQKPWSLQIAAGWAWHGDRGRGYGVPSELVGGPIAAYDLPWRLALGAGAIYGGRSRAWQGYLALRLKLKEQEP